MEMLPKIDNKEVSDSSKFFYRWIFVNSLFISTPPTWLAWCSWANKIDVIDLETKQDYATFDGASISDTGRYEILCLSLIWL